MKTAQKRTRLPLKKATDGEIVRLLTSTDPEELEEQGIMVHDPDHSDLHELLRQHLSEPTTAS